MTDDNFARHSLVHQHGELTKENEKLPARRWRGKMGDLLERLIDAETNKRPHPFRRIDGDMAVSPIYAVSAYELAELAQEIRERDIRVAEFSDALNKYKENELLLSKDGVNFKSAYSVLKEQAARIAALEAALKPFAEHAALVDAHEYDPDDTIICGFGGKYLMAGDLRAARAAMEGK